MPKKSSSPAGGYATRRSYRKSAMDEAGDISVKKKKNTEAPVTKEMREASKALRKRKGKPASKDTIVVDGTSYMME